MDKDATGAMWIGSLLCLLIVIAAGYWNVRFRLEEHAAAQNHTTTGYITAFEANFRKARRSRGGTSLNIRYDYEVNGNRYTGSEVRPGFADAGPRELLHDLHHIAASGEPIEVFYDPSDPSQAWLVQDARMNERIAAGAFFFAALGSLFYSVMVSMKKASRGSTDGAHQLGRDAVREQHPGLGQPQPGFRSDRVA